MYQAHHGSRVGHGVEDWGRPGSPALTAKECEGERRYRSGTWRRRRRVNPGLYIFSDSGLG